MCAVFSVSEIKSNFLDKRSVEYIRSCLVIENDVLATEVYLVSYERIAVPYFLITF